MDSKSLRSFAGSAALFGLTACSSPASMSASTQFGGTGGAAQGSGSSHTSTGATGGATGGPTGTGGGIIFNPTNSSSGGPAGADGGSCPIATIGVPGKYGQGDLFMSWLSVEFGSPAFC
jgi:hypothetical protein